MPAYLNYLSNKAGTFFVEASSFLPSHHPSNLLIEDDKKMWISREGLPQSLTFSIPRLQRKNLLRWIGFKCWHDYQSNPKVIRLQFSSDGNEFVPWGCVSLVLKAGEQFFEIDPISKLFTVIRITIQSSHGAQKVYLNQLFLYQQLQKQQEKCQSFAIQQPKGKLSQNKFNHPKQRAELKQNCCPQKKIPTWDLDSKLNAINTNLVKVMDKLQAEQKKLKEGVRQLINKRSSSLCEKKSRMASLIRKKLKRHII